MSKGSKYRPVDWDKYSENYDRIFKKTPVEEKIDPPKEHQCPDCGQWDWHECQPGMIKTYGRRGWRQVGIYDG